MGSYEITAPIGAGGMGEVYRARDMKLNRDVAIKVLPDLFAADHDRLRRFEREAQVLASLNHPNIAHVYGVEQRALVMELVEGEDLAQRLSRGPIPMDEVFPIATQIAAALEAAHEHGVIHRDLKPANIKVRPDGTVKVLDFGLAKAMSAEGVGATADALNSPTFTSPAMTAIGVILGTAAYMPPEQARGKPVDKRADIWAFGCVLYEMLGGRQAFGGDTITDVLAAIVRQDPDWSTLPAETPASVRRLLQHCLQKDPTERLRDIGDARWELEGRDALPALGAPPSSRSARRRERLAWIIAALATVAGSAAAITSMALRPAAPEAAEIRLEFNTPPTPDALSIAISPDGRDVAFAAFSGGQSRLLLRPLGVDAMQTLNGTEGGLVPFWSPDGRSLGFFANGALKRVDRNGTVQALARAPGSRGGAWGADNTIVFSPTSAGSLLRVSAAGGELTPATRLLEGQQSHRFPHFLSDHRHFVFYAQASDAGKRGIYLTQLGSLDAKYLADSDVAAVVAGDDALLFIRQGNLASQRLDVAAGKLVGEPVLIANDVAVDSAMNVAAVSATRGTIIFRRGGAIGLRDLIWYDRSGKTLSKVGDTDASYPRVPELSPDERRIAVYRSVSGNTDVWLIDALRGGRTRFTFDGAADVFPVWSPDGSRIVFASSRTGIFNLYTKASSGSGNEELILESPRNKVPAHWSPDGQYLVYRDSTEKGYDLWALPMSGDRTPIPLATTPFEEREAQVSPDSRWLAYQSTEAGRFEIYIQAFPAASGKWQVSQNGGAQPRWSADGKQLYYMALDGRLHVVDIAVTPDRAIDAGTDLPLFTPRTAGGPLPGSDKQQYVVARDGRLLVAVRPEGDQPSPLSVVLNWKAPR